MLDELDLLVENWIVKHNHPHTRICTWESPSKNSANNVMYTKISQFHFCSLNFWSVTQMMAFNECQQVGAIGITRGSIPLIPLKGRVQDIFLLFLGFFCFVFLILILLRITSTNLQCFLQQSLTYNSKQLNITLGEGISDAENWFLRWILTETRCFESK